MTLLGLAAAIFLVVTVVRFVFGWLSDTFDALYKWEVTPDRELGLCILFGLVWGQWISGVPPKEVAVAIALAAIATSLLSIMLLLRARLMQLLTRSRP